MESKGLLWHPLLPGSRRGIWDPGGSAMVPRAGKFSSQLGHRKGAQPALGNFLGWGQSCRLAGSARGKNPRIGAPRGGWGGEPGRTGHAQPGLGVRLLPLAPVPVLPTAPCPSTTSLSVRDGLKLTDRRRGRGKLMIRDEMHKAR